MSAPRIVAAGDSALIVEFEERIDPAVNAHVIAVAEALQLPPIPAEVASTLPSEGLEQEINFINFPNG